MIKPSLLVFFLLSFLLVQVSQGIRFERGFVQVVSKNGGFGEAVVCREGHCKGMARKLLTLATSTTIPTTSKNDKTGENKSKTASKAVSTDAKTGDEEEKFRVNSSSSETNYEHDHQTVSGHDNYVDIMDYSPARRKPPIHN